jgi:uncharacterized protein GlcG (DUF336 family)
VNDIDLETARAIIAAAHSTGSAADLKPLAVVVLDRTGNPRAFERADGASNLRYDVAHAKAYGALGLGMGSRALQARAEQQPYFIASVTAAIGGALIAVPGGVLVRNADGALIGAVGVSGDTSDNDELAAVSGIEAVGLVADPG